jgi:hypothetical protein
MFSLLRIDTPSLNVANRSFDPQLLLMSGIVATMIILACTLLVYTAGQTARA